MSSGEYEKAAAAAGMDSEEYEKLMNDPQMRQLLHNITHGVGDFKIDRGGAGPAQPIKNIVVPEGASHDEQMEVLQREMAADQANRERQEKAKRAEEEKKKQARGEPSRTPPASRRGARPRLSSPTRPSFAGAEPAKRRLVLCADGRRLG